MLGGRMRRDATNRVVTTAKGPRLVLALGIGLALPLVLLPPSPAKAQWGDSYDQPRRRGRDAYYREDDGYARAPRRAVAPEPEQRQFYWPWEDRPSAPEPRQLGPALPSATSAPAGRCRRHAAPGSAAADPAGAHRGGADACGEEGGGEGADRGVRRFARPTTSAAASDDVFADSADVAVIDRAKGDSGLVRRDVIDWPKAAEDYLKANPKVGYAVVMLGANDRQPIRDGDQTVDPLTDRWRELYRARVEALVKVFDDRKIPLVWVGTPPMRSESLTRDLGSINDIVRDAVTKGGGTYVDVGPGFSDDRNHYTATGPDLDGQNAKLRTADGVHFTHAGARKLAHFADVELKRLMGGTMPTAPEQPAAAVSALPATPLDAAPTKLDDVTAIDRQITAMLPSLPEPPGVPALPVKPAAGPVVPLGRVELSPGGVLVSGRPRDGDATGTVERALQRGAAPLPQPGRADDFRWPPG